MSTLCAERFTSPVTYHGEGPFWDSENGRLLCVDALAGTIVAVDASGQTRRYVVPSSVVTVIRRKASGGYLLATEREVVTADDQFATFNTLAHLPIGRQVRTNDGGCDPHGGFVIGTMAYDERPGAGNVYRVTPDGRTVLLLSSVTISNGVQWSADGTRAYYVDTPTRRIDVFDVDSETGAWLRRRGHIWIQQPGGFPDGMAIDEEGGLWVALWGVGAVNHYDNAGRFVEAIDVPRVTQASSCTFGGDGSVLFITTSRQGLAEDAEPDAGSIYAVQTRSRGAAPFAYAG